MLLHGVLVQKIAFTLHFIILSESIVSKSLILDVLIIGMSRYMIYNIATFSIEHTFLIVHHV